jgi:hypothetical protein
MVPRSENVWKHLVKGKMASSLPDIAEPLIFQYAQRISKRGMQYVAFLEFS